jgi:hypothetical protein
VQGPFFEVVIETPRSYSAIRPDWSSDRLDHVTKTDSARERISWKMVRDWGLFPAFLTIDHRSILPAPNASRRLCANVTRMQTVPLFTIQP